MVYYSILQDNQDAQHPTPKKSNSKPQRIHSPTTKNANKLT